MNYYNDIQRVKPYYNTMNSRYNNNIPQALPLIRNNHFDHSNVTVAPPIPSYYKQNINSSNYYSHLPNIMNITYSSAENIAKKFSNNLKNLQNIEDKITEQNREFNLPKLNQIENDKNYKNQLKESMQNKIENGNDDEDIKEKMSQMRQVAGRIPDYKTEEQKRMIQNKEMMSEEGINKFNSNLVSALSDYSNNIQKTIKTKNTNDANMYDMIKKGIDSLKEDFSERIDKFNKESKRNMEMMRKLMMNSQNPRLKLLSEHLFATSDIDQIIKLREKNKKNASVIDTRRMSVLMQQAADNARAENEKKKNEELKSMGITQNKDGKNGTKTNKMGDNGEIVEKIPLDLWEKRRKEALVMNQAIKEKVAFYSQSYFELQPLNRFRSIVFLVMGARRMLNIRYIMYKEFKFDSVSYYINNFEDMDIILKKLVYNTVKEPLLEILNDTELNINLTYDNEDNHEVFNLLQDYIERIINGFNTKFFNGVSGEMLSYLALYVTNQSFIPKDFFTTFELVRFRTTETGEFIELDDNNRKMILIFYIFIKILLRNIFLELIFNQADRKKLTLNAKLNVKMLVSVLYRSIIKNLTKNCVTKTNLDDLEEAEDMTAFLKLRYTKREFHLHRFLKKRYFLKVSEVEDKPKRISKRAREPISPRSSEGEDDNEDVRKIRETNRTKNEKKRKKIEKIKKEQNDQRQSNENEESSGSGSGSGSGDNSQNGNESGNGDNSNEEENENDENEEGENNEEDEEAPDVNQMNKNNNINKKNKKTKNEKNEESDNDEENEGEDSEEEDNKNKKNNKNQNNKKQNINQKNNKKKKDDDDEDNEDEQSENSDDDNKNKKKRNVDNNDSGRDIEEEEEEENQAKKKSKKKSKGRAPPPKKKEETESSYEEYEDSKTESMKSKNKKKKNSKLQSKANSVSSNSKMSKSKKNIKKSPHDSSDEIREINEEEGSSNEEDEKENNNEENEEDEELEIPDDNYKEERAKLMPKRKVSTEKINGRVKTRLMGEEQKVKIAIRGRDPLKGKDTIKDFSKSDIDNMYFIIENFQSYGDDLDSNEVDLLDKVLYTEKNLETYYLYANEYSFDPGDMISKFMDKLLEKIQINFSK